MLPYNSLQPGSRTTRFVEDTRPQYWESVPGISRTAFAWSTVECTCINFGSGSGGTAGIPLDGCSLGCKPVQTRYFTKYPFITCDQCYQSTYVFAKHNNGVECINSVDGNPVSQNSPGWNYIGDQNICTCDGVKIKYAWENTFFGVDGKLRFRICPSVNCITSLEKCNARQCYFNTSIIEVCRCGCCDGQNFRMLFGQATATTNHIVFQSTQSSSTDVKTFTFYQSTIPFWKAKICGCCSDRMSAYYLCVCDKCIAACTMAGHWGDTINVDAGANEWYGFFSSAGKLYTDTTHCSVFGHILEGDLIDGSSCVCGICCTTIKKIIPLPITGHPNVRCDCFVGAAAYHTIKRMGPNNRYTVITGSTRSAVSKCSNALPWPIIYDSCCLTINTFLGNCSFQSCNLCNCQRWASPGVIGVTPRNTIIGATVFSGCLHVYEFCDDLSSIPGGCYIIERPGGICTLQSRDGTHGIDDFADMMYDEKQDKLVVGIYKIGQSWCMSCTGGWQNLPNVHALPTNTLEMCKFVTNINPCGAMCLNSSNPWTQQDGRLMVGPCVSSFNCWTTGCVCEAWITCGTAGCFNGYISSSCMSAGGAPCCKELLHMVVGTSAMATQNFCCQITICTTRCTTCTGYWCVFRPLQHIDVCSDFASCTNFTTRQRVVNYYPFHDM